MAAAMKNPPMKRKITGLAYGAAAALGLPIPRAGINTRGSSAVTASGTATVNHQIAIQPVIARVA